LSTNPDDARAYLLLGEAYLRLLNQPRAQPWQAALPELAAIRRVQALTALEQVVLLRPDLDEAHALLADLYYQMGQMDRALDHLRARLRIAGREAGKSGPDAQAAAERQTGLSGDVEAMETRVRRSLDIYAANTAGKTDPSKVYDRARLAFRHGLSRKALEMLLESYPEIFGNAGAKMQLELMLQAGRAFEVRAWLEPEHEAMLGFRDYHWFQARAAAACGDYDTADAELKALSEQLRQVGLAREKFVPVRSAMAFWAGGVVLALPARPGNPATPADVLRHFQPDALQRLSMPVGLLREEANLQTLRGLLALEPGAVETAREHFRAALNVWGEDARAAEGAGLDFSARPLAQEMNRLLEEAGEKK
jgi:tetratricopeptide (TPR) repeat protein